MLIINIRKLLKFLTIGKNIIPQVPCTSTPFKQKSKLSTLQNKEQISSMQQKTSSFKIGTTTEVTFLHNNTTLHNQPTTISLFCAMNNQYTSRQECSNTKRGILLINSKRNDVPFNDKVNICFAFGTIH